LNDFQAAVEEGIVVGGGCTLLRLASKVDAIKDTLDNDEEKVSYLLKFQVLGFGKLWKSHIEMEVLNWA
jgi:chaperonin GroEL (HSP60 family)